MADNDQKQGLEAALNGKVTRRDFIKVSAGTVACISLGSLTFGCGSSTAQAAGYPIDATVTTTLQKTVKPSQSFSGTIASTDLKNIAEYDSKGYGVWADGGGLAPVLRNDIMAAAYSYPADASRSKTLLRFFAITDIHITDKESPAQVIYLQLLMGMETSTYSPTMLYSTQVLDAAIQTVNALHKQNPIDFGISLGDASNSTQYNETRWYIDVIDGKVITPSSGAHAGANSIDYQKPFKAAGLNPAIPWYQAIGNHDHFYIGSIPPDAGDLRGTYTSSEVVAMANTLLHADDIYNTKGNPLYYMGVIDGSTPYGDVVKAGPVEEFATPPTVVPDSDRRSLTKAEWVNEFFKTSTSPVGHGFNLVPPGQGKGFACYSFVPKATVPLKVIVLDNTQREDDGATSIHGRGFLDKARWTWLKKELAAGDAAGQLMIIAAHIPIGVSPHASDIGGKDTYMDWYDTSANPATMQNAVNLPGLLAELHSHPNLLMWIAGHRHVNTVKAFVSDDPAKPERGFWQVETSSLHDFPQQFRTFDLKLNSDYTISIAATNVDPAVKEGTPAWTARKYAVAAQQIVKTNLKPNPPNADPTRLPGVDSSITKTNEDLNPNIGSYNAELFVQLSPEMKEKMRSLFPTL